MLHTRWSAEAWSEVRVEFRQALALLSEIRRAGRFGKHNFRPADLHPRSHYGDVSVAVGMQRQGFDLQLTQYDDRGWRATFYATGMEHSPTSATGTAWERTPWHATQRARLGGAEEA